MNNNIQTNERTVLISKQTKNLAILIISVIIITIISGILGAFKSGKFMKTYDFVEVNIPFEEVNYNDDIFKDWTNRSKEIIKYETEYIFNEETQTSIPVKVKMYKGYNTKYFFQSAWFYGDAITNSIIVLIFYISLVGYLLSRRLENDDVYMTLENEINEEVHVKNNLPSVSFEPFMYQWNLKRKIKQHISNIRYKLSKHERKTKFKIRKEFYIKDEEGNTIFNIPNRELKFKEKIYLNKKERLESFVTEEYIKTHVEFEKVKHFRHIHPSFVTTGKNDIIQSTDEYSALKSDRKKQTEDYLMKGLLGMSISFAVASLLSFSLMKVDEGWLIVLYNVFMRMVPLVIQIVFAINYVNVIMKNQMIPTLKYRLNIINMYLANKEVE